MPAITISMSKEEFDAIEKRGKLNYMSAKEQAEDILRRSMTKYKNKTPSMDSKLDDKLVSLFSKQKTGRKRKK